jgi:Zn-dependent metalloprotease
MKIERSFKMMVRFKTMSRKGLACWMVVALLISLFPGLISAAGNTKTEQITLEQAVQIAKKEFQIPAELTRFTSGYNQFEDRQVWTLNWDSEKQDKGSMNIQVDSQTGEITDMNLWQPNEKQRSGARLPAISRNEAVKKAEQLVKSIQPQRYNEMKLVENSGEILRLMSWEPGSYSIKWQRTVNGIEYPQDGVTVGINNENGQITSYNFRWTKADFPSADKVISPDMAKQVFEKEELLRLQYFLVNSLKPTETRKAILVYRVDDASQGYIDALTGKPLDVNTEFSNLREIRDGE